MMPRMGGYYPSEHKTTHQDGGRDEIDLEGLENKAKVVWRATSDLTLNLLNQTATTDWTNLDLTAATSANAKFAIIKLMVHIDSYSSGRVSVRVRKDGTTTPVMDLEHHAPDMTTPYVYGMVIVEMATGQVIEYSTEISGTAQADFQVRVQGYIE